MILPPGHGQSLALPRRRLRRAEKWVIGSVVGLLCAGAVALGLAFAGGGRAVGHGCVEVSVQAATGGSEIYRCGAQALALCASASLISRGNPVVGAAVATACRKAHIPVR